MHIYNFKVNGNLLYKIFFFVLFAVALFFVFLGSKIIFTHNNSNNFKTNDTYQLELNSVTPSNYTNILEFVHSNLDNYIDKTFSFSGYVYRTLDIKENQFVLARDMIISSDLQTLVVGFLCEYENAQNFKDKEWVQIEGCISKTDFFGEIPLIKVSKIEKIEKPSEEFVYPPNTEKGM